MMPAVPLLQRPTATESFFAEGCFITEWWNSTADMAVSVARARVEPGVTTRWHRLRGVTERYLILEGQGRVEVGEGPAETADQRSRHPIRGSSRLGRKSLQLYRPSRLIRHPVR